MLGKEHPSTLTSMNNLAEVLHRQGNYEEAERIHQQELALREEKVRTNFGSKVFFDSIAPSQSLHPRELAVVYIGWQHPV